MCPATRLPEEILHEIRVFADALAKTGHSKHSVRFHVTPTEVLSLIEHLELLRTGHGAKGRMPFFQIYGVRLSCTDIDLR
jgi:hypothetical protein